MNGIDFLADTNAIIYLLAGNECMKPYLNKNLPSVRLSEGALPFLPLGEKGAGG